jgi:hypothetical protein
VLGRAPKFIKKVKKIMYRCYEGLEGADCKNNGIGFSDGVEK